MKAIIIGSGLSGLTTGAYLSREGYQVVIYEQHTEIGGVTATIHKEGYSWDLGPLLLEGLAPHEKLGKIMIELGIYDKISLIKKDRGQSLPNFDIWRPKEYQGPYWRKSFFKNLFPEEEEGLDNYYDFYDKMMKLIFYINQIPFVKGLKGLLLKLKLFFNYLKVKKYEKWSAAELTDHFFSNQKLKTVFLGILADFVVKPSEFPGLGVPMVNVETAFDKRIPTNYKGIKLPEYHYIINGCEQLIFAFSDLITSNNGEIHTNKKVEKIIIKEGKARGIKLEDGTEDSGDLIIASGGIFNTFYNLIGKEYLPPDFIENIENIKLMESVLMVHIGIDFDPTPHQREALCYYYRTYDIETAIEDMREGKYHEGKDGFLIFIPSLFAPNMAPSGKHTITIYTVAPHKLKNGNWEELKEELGEKLLIEAEKIIPKLRDHIQTKIIMTPDDFKERINVVRHSFGGTAPAMGQENPSHRTPIENLWYIGAYSESGGGVAGVAMGARNVSKMILGEK
ncbi:MAG: NAD(P)-binding protein [Candidatus Lokiarchaeota archaeon]|nr:NAD(P)-binding protein [Candidatus Lokiarchaeota archaeon]MBD3338709.1 NAD(P)-binding protein [Candidatus Lokiarchaeota archaeon]